MRGKELLDKMELADLEFVQEAEIKHNKKSGFIKWTALAASLLLIVAVVLYTRDYKKPPVAEIVTPPIMAVDPPIADQPTLPDPFGDVEGQDIPIGGGDTRFMRLYVDEVYNIAIASDIVGREASDEWTSSFLELSAVEQEELPTLYRIINDLGIPKEAIIKKNEEYGEYASLTDDMIDALYEDIDTMKMKLRSPLALYHNGEIYTLDGLKANPMQLSLIPLEVIDDYLDYITDYCTSEGEIKYMREEIESVRTLANDESLKFNSNYGVGGDGNSFFYSPLSEMFSAIEVSVIRYVGEDKFNDWVVELNERYEPASSLMEYANPYSVAMHFGITKEEMQELMSDSELIELIYSGDESAIISKYVNEFTIVIGERFYSPYWLYVHSIEDYKKAGITPDMLIDSKGIRYTFGLEAHAAKVFEDKLSKFVGHEIDIRGKIMNPKNKREYYIPTEEGTYDLEWLTGYGRTIQDYEKVGITVEKLENLKDEIEFYNETSTYEFIDSCIHKMKE